jgi:hypothetical protein
LVSIIPGAGNFHYIQESFLSVEFGITCRFCFVYTRYSRVSNISMWLWAEYLTSKSQLRVRSDASDIHAKLEHP